MKGSNTPNSVWDEFDKMKSRHPDAIILFRYRDSYRAYKEDAVNASPIFDIEARDGKVNGKKVKITEFPHDALDTYLPKLVRAGMRVVICDPPVNPKQKRKEKSTKENISNSKDMPKKKKDQTPEQEQPKAKAETKTDVKTEAKAEVKTEQKSEPQQGHKTRDAQMVTVNGDKITHGHAFQDKDSQDWYFTAKINGEQLKPQKMDQADLAVYQRKGLTVPYLMERYYPTKLMPKVPEVAFKTPNVLTGPDGNITIDKFNVYKEKDPERPDFGKYKFYAQIGENKMSTVASRQDLNAYFDRVMTPGQLVERNFGERLHLSSYYQQFKLPEDIEKEQIRIAKDRSDGKWKVSVDLGERGKTEKKEMSFDDGFSLYKTKTATREQIAAKYEYVGEEVKSLLATPAAKMEKSTSMKM